MMNLGMAIQEVGLTEQARRRYLIVRQNWWLQYRRNQGAGGVIVEPDAGDPLCSPQSFEFYSPLGNILYAVPFLEYDRNGELVMDCRNARLNLFYYERETAFSQPTGNIYIYYPTGEEPRFSDLTSAGSATSADDIPSVVISDFAAVSTPTLIVHDDRFYKSFADCAARLPDAPAPESFSFEEFAQRLRSSAVSLPSVPRVEPARIAGEQFAVPEFGAPPDAVLVGAETITKNHNYALVQAILDADVPVWISTNDVGDQNPFMPRDFAALRRAASLEGLRTALGDDFDRLRFLIGEPSSWTRDWAPMSTFTPQGEPRLLSFQWSGGRSPNDGATKVGAALGVGNLFVSGIGLDHGNFMISEGGDCAITRYTVENNIFRVSDYRQASSYVDTVLRQAFGCRQVIIFDTMPAEQTGHIDIWAQFVGNNLVIVGKVYDEAFQNLWGGFHGELNQVKTFLDDRAREFHDEYGYEVLRIPMAVTTYRHDGADRLEMRSYVNSLMLGDTVVVPRYEAPVRDTHYYPDAFAHGLYEQHVEQAYWAAGFERVVFVNMDREGNEDGAVHCVTREIRLTPPEDR